MTGSLRVGGGVAQRERCLYLFSYIASSKRSIMPVPVGWWVGAQFGSVVQCARFC